MKTNLILVLCLVFSALSSSAQHRVKLNQGSSLYVNIKELKEDSISFSFYRQDEIFSIPRSDVSYIKPMVFDNYLLYENFKLTNPYEIYDFILDDEIIFTEYLKYNKLNYRKLNAKVLEVDSVNIKYISYLDNDYFVGEMSFENVESINYSQKTMHYLLQDSVDVGFKDVVLLRDGEKRELYIYEIGYQGIKYSDEPLPNYVSQYTDSGRVKHRNLKRMEFMSYSDINSISLANGTKFLVDFYLPKKKKKLR